MGRLINMVFLPADLVRRDMEKRQEFVIDTEQASMTTVKGDVVPFDTANVNLQGAPQS